MIEQSAPTRRVVVTLLARRRAGLHGLRRRRRRRSPTKGTTVNVMTRNLYLGADLGAGARSRPRPAAFFEANGGIVRQVEATNFPVRAKGLAKEILENEPDLVGLQEVALWREAPPTVSPS